MPVDCENYSALLSVFGPDYSRLKPKLGHIRGLFDGVGDNQYKEFHPK
jgi:hypothetical protein